MTLDASRADRTGLIREAYRIDGITAEECRSILLDWAIKLPDDLPPAESIRWLLAEYGRDGHPMTALLTQALTAPAAPGRRGGWRGRR